MSSMNWNDFKLWLQKQPKWLRYTIVCLVAAIGVLSYIFSSSACSAIRISQTSTGEIKVSSSQKVLDSTKIEINVLNKKHNGI